VVVTVRTRYQTLDHFRGIGAKRAAANLGQYGDFLLSNSAIGHGFSCHFWDLRDLWEQGQPRDLLDLPDQWDRGIFSEQWDVKEAWKQMAPPYDGAQSL
jgi:hypothetical protein